jgi:4-hydroxy-3-polyprenylbenzoate decarboxylase
MKRYVMAMAGASGAVLGLRVLEGLLNHAEAHLVMSPTAIEILRDETGIDFSGRTEDEMLRKVRGHFNTDRVFCWSAGNLKAPVSSGSFQTDGMLVVPCSMKTLSGIANGYAGTLIERAADVTIKEGRRILLAPREMPFSALHLENMLKLARLGVVIAPPALAFYQRPEDLGDMVDFLAGKILDAMGIGHRLYTRWGGEVPDESTLPGD